MRPIRGGLLPLCAPAFGPLALKPAADGLSPVRESEALTWAPTFEIPRTPLACKLFDMIGYMGACGAGINVGQHIGSASCEAPKGGNRRK